MRPEAQDTPPPSRTEEVIGHVKDYIQTQAEIIKLTAIDKAAGGIAVVSLVAVLIFLFTAVFVLLSIGLALVISKLIGEGSSGFFIVAGFYILVAVILYATRDSLLKKAIAGSIIKGLWPDHTQYKEEHA